MNPPPSPLPPLPLPLCSSTSCLPHCPLLDLSIIADPAPESRPHHIKPRPQSRPGGNDQVQFESAVATVTPEPHRLTPHPLQQQQEPIRGQWSMSHLRCNSTASQEPGSSALPNQLPEFPEGVGLNSTLALRAELQSLQGQQWDSVKAVKENLEKSQRKQTLLNNRATSGVSFPRRAQLYSALVSVHVPEGHVIREAALQRLPLAPAPKALLPSTCGPSLLPLTSDLFHHRPLPFHEPGPASCLKPHPHSIPSSLFRRLQQWGT